MRPGKILAIRIHAETAGYAARVPPDLFAIAQTDLPESAATSIAPDLRVWKNGTVPQGDTWGPVMSTMPCNVIRWRRWSWKLHRLIEMSPPPTEWGQRVEDTLLEPHGGYWSSTLKLLINCFFFFFNFTYTFCTGRRSRKKTSVCLIVLIWPLFCFVFFMSTIAIYGLHIFTNPFDCRLK